MEEKREKPGKPKGRGNDEGSIFERKGEAHKGKKKNWVAQITLEDGRKKSICCESHKEAQQALRKAQSDIEQGKMVVGRDQTVKEYMEFWIENVQRLLVRESTYMEQKQHIQKHIIPGLGRHYLRKLSTDHVEKFYSELFRKGLSAGTIKNIHAILSKAFKQAFRKQKVLRNVFELIDAPQYSLPERTPLTLEQAHTLLALMQGHRYEMLFKLALATGMREGELLALRWEDIDFAGQSLQVRHTVGYYAKRGFIESEPKTKYGKRKVTLPGFLLAELEGHRARQELLLQKAGSAWRDYGLVFPNRYGSYIAGNTVRANFYLLLERAGLPPMHVHDLRHSSATFLLAMKVNARTVQERLGHSHVSVTLALYGHVTPGMQEGAADEIGKVFEISEEKEKGASEEEEDSE